MFLFLATPRFSLAQYTHIDPAGRLTFRGALDVDDMPEEKAFDLILKALNSSELNIATERMDVERARLQARVTAPMVLEFAGQELRGDVSFKLQAYHNANKMARFFRKLVGKAGSAKLEYRCYDFQFSYADSRSGEQVVIPFRMTHADARSQFEVQARTLATQLKTDLYAFVQQTSPEEQNLARSAD